MSVKDMRVEYINCKHCGVGQIATGEESIEKAKEWLEEHEKEHE